MQEDIYDQVINALKFPVVEQRSFDMEFLRRHYPHEMTKLVVHGIDLLMQINHNYSEELIKEFFATIYFHNDEARTMQWMSAGVECTKTLREFAQIWKFPMPQANDDRFFKVHDESVGVLPYTPYLDMAYPPGHAGDAPSVPKMTQRYHLYNKVFRNTIAIKQGDKGFVRGWLVNTLYYLEQSKRIDIMDYIYEEIRLSVFDRKCCILAPYLQIIIEHCIGTVANSYKKIEHKVVSYPPLKDTPPPPPSQLRTQMEAPDSGWKANLKKIFCLQVDVQRQNYKIHRSNKMI
jgi:hypothetical protein